MKTQVKWFRIYEDNMIYINEELAKLQPPKYQIVDIKFVNNAQFTRRNEMLVIYNEYEV